MFPSIVAALHQHGRLRVGTFVLALAVTGGLAGCSSQAGSTGAAAAPSAQNSAAHAELDGTYAVTWTVDELAEALGGPENPEAQHLAEENAGTAHLVFESGSYDLIGVEASDSCPGSYELDGERIVATATINPADWDCGRDSLGQKAIDATWRVDGDSLTLTEWALPDEPAMIGFNAVLLGTKPLERVDR